MRTDTRFVTLSMTLAAGLALAAGTADLHALTVIRYVRGMTVAALSTVGTFSQAYGINDRGEIVGAVGLADGRRHAFRYAAGVMEDLNPAGYRSEARAINQHSEIAGSAAFTPTGNQQPATFSAGRAWPLPLPVGCSWWGAAAGLNDVGGMAGTGYPNSGCGSDAGLYWPSRFTVLPWYANEASMRDVNDSGVAIGGYLALIGKYRAIAQWRTIVTPLRVPFGVAGTDCNVYATDVNNAGVIVGQQSCADGSNHGLRWPSYDADAARIPMPSGWIRMSPTALNEQGYVVGEATKPTALGTTSFAFVWGSDIGGIELPPLSSRGLPCSAAGVSNLAGSRMSIAGSCKIGTTTRAVRWDVELGWLFVP